MHRQRVSCKSSSESCRSIGYLLDEGRELVVQATESRARLGRLAVRCAMQQQIFPAASSPPASLHLPYTARSEVAAGATMRLCAGQAQGDFLSVDGHQQGQFSTAGNSGDCPAGHVDKSPSAVSTVIQGVGGVVDAVFQATPLASRPCQRRTG